MATITRYVIHSDGITQELADGYGEISVGLPNGDVHYFTGADESTDPDYSIEPGSHLLRIRRAGQVLRTYNAWVWVEGDRTKRTSRPEVNVW